MRQSTGVARSQDAISNPERLHPLGGVAALALSLPALGDASVVQDAASTGAGKVKSAKLARALLAKGFLPSPDEVASVEVAVEVGLGRWLAAQVGSLCCLSVGASLHPNVWEAHGLTAEQVMDELQDGVPEKREREVFGLIEGQDHVGVVLEARHCDCLDVKQGVEALEAKLPGFGYAAARLAMDALTQFGVWGFEQQAYQARNTYWGGCESELEWLEEWGGEDDDYQGVTAAELDVAFQLKQFAAQGSKREWRTAFVELGEPVELQRFIELVESLQRLERATVFQGHELCMELEFYESISPSAIVVWGDSRLALRIGDDFAQMVMESDGRTQEFIGVIGLSLEANGRGLSAQGLRWRKGLRRLRLADELMARLTGMWKD
jgi:hypothetical protein